MAVETLEQTDRVAVPTSLRMSLSGKDVQVSELEVSPRLSLLRYLPALAVDQNSAVGLYHRNYGLTHGRWFLVQVGIPDVPLWVAVPQKADIVIYGHMTDFDLSNQDSLNVRELRGACPKWKQLIVTDRGLVRVDSRPGLYPWNILDQKRINHILYHSL